MKLFITGETGFVGNYFLKSLNPGIQISLFQRKHIPSFEEDIILHLAGKSKDQREVSDPKEYYSVNTELTKKVYDTFLASQANVFITLSSVKAVADQVEGELIEESVPNPKTHYGKSKLLAEQYIFSRSIPEGKRVYVLRPCMIHGPGNKGNLNLLYRLASRQIPWPLVAFENKRSLCSIDNLCFVIKELIEREDIPSGIYNVADDEPVSTNELIRWMAKLQNKKPILWHIPKGPIKMIAKFGDLFRLPLNSERLQKLTESYVVSNNKLVKAIGKPLPFSAKEGLMKTFTSFTKVK